MAIEFKPGSWERMIRAVEKVRERLGRATAALDAAGVAYAVIGGNAVAAWVSTVDPSAIRNTADVDLLLRRQDFDRAANALQAIGFVPQEVLGVPMFLDGEQGGPRDALHILLANELVRPDDLGANPDVVESNDTVAAYRVLSLEALVRMKLISYRIKDRMHLLDLMEVGLIDQSWVARFPEALGARLQQLIDNPNA